MITHALPLAKFNQGDESEATTSELRIIEEQAELAGLMTALPAMELALAG